MDDRRALVLFSGGQDSATCLAWALEKFEHIETIGFNYGQRHSIELVVRREFLSKLRTQFPNWGTKLREDHIADLTGLTALGETAMTHDVEIRMNANQLPNTFVPGRNIAFFTFAAAVAYRRDCKHLVAGMCETDYSGYPDCRDDTIKALQATLNLGMETRLVIETPLMWITKAETWRFAETLGGKPLIDLIQEHTHTCYRGDRSVKHKWGYGCGNCPACDLRRNGYEIYAA